MKLLRLKLNTDFRSLHKGFEVHFLRDFDFDSKWEFNPYCLAGRNGSGKSNIMEALAAIFYHIECIYLDNRPDEFEADEDNPDGFKSEVSDPDAYELEYLVHIPDQLKLMKVAQHLNEPGTVHVSVIKEVGKRPQFKILNSDLFFEKEPKQLERELVKELLPEYIIGYSSGENEILSLPFFKMRFIHFDEYLYRLEKKYDYRRPEGRFIFADQGYSQAIFLANYLMQNDEVLNPFLKVLGIEKLDRFRIIIRENEPAKKYVSDEYVEPDYIESNSDEYVALTDLVEKSIIDKLTRCATSHYSDENGTLYLDYLVNEDTRKAFRLLFDNDPVSLFQSFQILLTLNLFEVDTDIKKDLYHSDSLYVNETVPVLASDRRIMRFKHFRITKTNVGSILTKSLSDGEHQYLHAIGICLLFKDSNSLFLLDEPETHLNPDWRASFISVLKDCLDQKENEDPVLQELLISSHSPFIISDCKKDNVLVFRKDETTEIVSCERPDFKTFGASVNQITIEIFDEYNTIGEFANNRLEQYWKLFENRDYKNLDDFIKSINREMGDSVEKTFLINRILERGKK